MSKAKTMSAKLTICGHEMEPIPEVTKMEVSFRMFHDEISMNVVGVSKTIDFHDKETSEAIQICNICRTILGLQFGKYAGISINIFAYCADDGESANKALVELADKSTSVLRELISKQLRPRTTTEYHRMLSELEQTEYGILAARSS